MNEPGEKPNVEKKETGFNTTTYSFFKHYQQHMESTEQKDIQPPDVPALNFLIEKTISGNKRNKIIEDLKKIVEETKKAERGEYDNIIETKSLIPTLREAAQLLLGEDPTKKK